MSSTREVWSISCMSHQELSRSHPPIDVYDPLTATDAQRRFLGRFLLECVSSGIVYVNGGPWKVSRLQADGTKSETCFKLSAPIVLRLGASYATHIRGEMIGASVSAGSFGSVSKILATLALQLNGDVSVNAVSRVIKRIGHDKSSINEIEYEAENGMRAGYLHMKMPVHHLHESYIVSRYFAGTVELFDIICRLYTDPSAYSTDKILRIILNILRAVKTQLHDRGIVSRDIKPENILVNPASEEVFNIDLGLSKLTHEVKRNESVGSLGYLSPEVFSKSGMTVKSDVYSLGVTFSLFLGACQHGDDLQASQGYGPCRVDFAKIFRGRDDLNDEEKKLLTGMLNSMMETAPAARLSLKDAILIVEGILLKRQQVFLDSTKKASMDQAYQLAVKMRDDIDIAEAAMQAYCSFDPLAAVDAFVDKLKNHVVNNLDKLPDCPEAINVFAETLSSKRIATLATRAAIREMFAADFNEYESRKMHLDAARHDVSKLFESVDDVNALAGNKAEAMELARQELGLIATALAYRVRSIAPAVDNLPLLMRKMDKSIAEFRRLDGYIKAGLHGAGGLGNHLISVGLFRLSPATIGRDQVVSRSIPMKNRQ